MDTDHMHTVTHIRISPERLYETGDSPYDIFGQRATELLNLTDMIMDIDLDASAFLYDRAVREYRAGSMEIEQILNMLQLSYEQLKMLSDEGVLRTFAA